VEAAIGGTAEATIVKSAPGIIGVRRRADCSHGDQDAEKTKREPHLFSFRTTLSRATPDRQSSSVSSGAKFFTRQFYLAARS